MPLSRIALLIAVLSASVLPAGAQESAESGKKFFNKCRACHEPERDVNKVGPHLVGIVGRAAGSVEGFNYSDAMKDAAANGLVWDEANLAAYLKDPKAFLPNTKMAFVGVKKDEEIADIIAFLKADPKP